MVGRSLGFMAIISLHSPPMLVSGLAPSANNNPGTANSPSRYCRSCDTCIATLRKHTLFEARNGILGL